MGKSSQHSIEFLRQLFELCERLAAKGFTIDSLDLNYGSFGYWNLNVRYEREVTMFSWEAREGILTIKGRVSKPNREGNSPLEILEEKKFDTSKGEDPKLHAQSFLESRYPA